MPILYDLLRPINFSAIARNSFRRWECTKIPKIRRSVLYVPACDKKKLISTHNFKKVDTVVIDLEDSVHASQKEAARHNAVEFFNNLVRYKDIEYGIRVNSRCSEYCEADIEALFGETRPDVILFPKVNSDRDFEWIQSKFNSINNLSKPIPFVLMIESAQGVINLQSILDFCEKNSEILCVDSLLFGSDDFLKSIGVNRSKDTTNLLYARQSIVIHAKAYGLGAIDMVETNYSDLDEFKKSSLASSNLGFTGRQIIHPSQIAIANEAYSPTEEQVKWATAVLEFYERGQMENQGVFTYEGRMVDKPLVEQAKNILKLKNKLKN